MVNPLCPLANPFCGCCLFGLLPRFLSGLLFFLDETQIWLGFAGRRGWCPCLFSGLFDFAYLYGLYWSLYKCLFDCLCSCKDRASEQHRPNARKKNSKEHATRAKKMTNPSNTETSHKNFHRTTTTHVRHLPDPWPLAKITINLDTASQWVSKMGRLFFCRQVRSASRGS